MTGRVPDDDAVEVVVLCTGNRARSPLAEALLRRGLTDPSVRIHSRGVVDVGSVPALPEMVTAARNLGVDLSGHRARAMALGELVDVDLVIGFEPSHTAAAVVDGGADRGTVFTLPELVALLDDARAGAEDLRVGVAGRIARANAGRSAGDAFLAPSIEDPLGGSRGTFDRIAREIAAGVDSLVYRLFSSSAGEAEPHPAGR